MKSLATYIFEALNATEKELLEKLSKQKSLADYVDVLNKMLKDKDAKNVLIKAFIEGQDNPAYKFDAKQKNIPVTQLHPTQSEIDVDKSLGYPFKNTQAATACMKMFFEDPVVVMPFPLITFEGKYIIDGHHRWSQVFAFNPDAKMDCFDITVKGGKVDEQEMLKITQGFIAAKRAEDGKGEIPANHVEGANLFKMSDKQIKDTVVSYCENKETAEIICNAAGQSTPEELADYLCDNLLELQKENRAYSRKGNPRGVMPQTDRGGDNPDDQKSAKPDAKGSVLNKFKSGSKTTHRAVK